MLAERLYGSEKKEEKSQRGVWQREQKQNQKSEVAKAERTPDS